MVALIKVKGKVVWVNNSKRLVGVRLDENVMFPVSPVRNLAVLPIKVGGKILISGELADSRKGKFVRDAWIESA